MNKGEVNYRTGVLMQCTLQITTVPLIHVHVISLVCMNEVFLMF